MDPVIFASLVALEPAGPQTLVAQLYRAVRSAVADGRLTTGEALPSSRAAAALLGVSRNTVNAAYDLLAAEGVVEIRRGAAPKIGRMPASAAARGAARSIVVSDRARTASAPIRRGISEGRLAPGSPDPTLFPSDAFGRILRRAARHRQDGAEGYAHYHGVPELRRVLADQLHRHRGLVVDPADIVVTPGTQASLALAAAAFADPGDVALLESPGYVGARTAFLAAGLACRGVPVDEDGAMPGDESLAGARLLYLTPSTQYPTGVRMPLARRVAVLEATARTGTVVLEDDYDSEFVWEGRGIAALAALPAADHVVSMGSAAKSLLPGLRIGWLAVPPGLAEPVRALQARLGLSANVHAQAALADWMGSGAYRAHVETVSRRYRDRMEMLVRALRGALGDRVDLSAPAGGLQIAIRFPGGVDDGPILERMGAAGFAVAALSDHCLDDPKQGLVVGFGSATERDARAFAQALAEALDEQRG